MQKLAASNNSKKQIIKYMLFTDSSALDLVLTDAADHIYSNRWGNKKKQGIDALVTVVPHN